MTFLLSDGKDEDEDSLAGRPPCMLGAEYRLPPLGCFGGSPPARTSIRETFEYCSAEDLDKTNVNASRVIPSECRDQVDGGGREERRKRPSDFPTMKDGRRQDRGRGGADEPSACLSRGTFDTSTPKVLRPNRGFKHRRARAPGKERVRSSWREIT